MADLIDRQKAIDALLGITTMRNTIPLDSAIFNIKKLPSAQPTQTNTPNALESLDCISRQAAIDEIDEWIKAFLENGHKESAADACLIQDGIIQLPPTQPEIIRCKDCRWGREACGNIECFVDSNIPPEYHGYEWFCPNGERRTDGVDS